MIFVDAHQDIAWNALGYERDYRTSALKHRQNEVGKGYPAATVGLPDSLLGRVGIVFATLFAMPQAAASLSRGALKSYDTPREAYQQALTQLDYYQRLSDEDERIVLVRRQSDLDTVLKSWAEGTETKDHKQGLVVLMEGADPIIEPPQFEEWYERGVRIVGTAWQQTRYSGGTRTPGGLTHLGNELLEVMASFNAVLDLSHMAEQAYHEALERYEGQIIASHSNPRRFCNSDRHLSDDMIRLLGERDGVIGVVLFNRFLDDKWGKGDAKLPTTIVADAIDHICQLTGSARHVGLGSDFDGGFGSESIPEDMDTSGDLNVIVPILKERGYSDEDIDLIASGNFLRVLRGTLPT